MKVKLDKGQEQCKVTHATSALGRDLKHSALWDSSNIWKAECPRGSFGIFWNGDTTVRGLAPTEEHAAVITVTDPRRRRAHIASDGENGTDSPVEASAVVCQQQRSSWDAIGL